MIYYFDIIWILLLPINKSNPRPPATPWTLYKYNNKLLGTNLVQCPSEFFNFFSETYVLQQVYKNDIAKMYCRCNH